ncbi:MAG TPA: hypothetical protein VNS81_06990 [Nocardioides sp.]|nr:hypothetical protein [Nocardioides sp.]
MNALAVAAASSVHLLVSAKEKAPEDEDVVAGWMGFAVFAFLIVAVALIGWALTRSLRTAARAKDAGVYGEDEPTAEGGPADGPAGGSQPSR